MKIKLKEIRKSRKMSMAQLSKFSGVSRSYISLIEKGIYKNIGANFICMLCNSLKCTPNDLISCDEDGGDCIDEK